MELWRRIAMFVDQRFLAAAVLLASGILSQTNPFLPNDDPTTGYQTLPSVLHRLGQHSPFFSVAALPNVSSTLPASCSVTFVQLLSRHGARFPTAGAGQELAATVAKLRQVPASAFTGQYAFLANYTYALGTADLTAFGQQELVNSGAAFYARYQGLARNATPFFRTSSVERVVVSAQNFTQGFHAARVADVGRDAAFPYGILALPADGNSTLDHGLCTAFENDAPFSTISDAETARWVSVFAPPITARLNAALPGANLTDADTVNVMDLCAFETVADAAAAPAPFCRLFAPDEWAAFDYAQSVGEWFSYGPGNALGPAQGVGWVNELAARLTGAPVADRTSSNATLDADPATFPLHRLLYADFTHDTVMTAVFSALGLFNATVAAGGLDASVQQPRGYWASRTVPFAARAYVEKMQCGGGAGEMVRVLLNDQVQPLAFCGGDKFGRCALEAFVDKLTFAREGGNWDLCFAGSS